MRERRKGDIGGGGVEGGGGGLRGLGKEGQEKGGGGGIELLVEGSSQVKVVFEKNRTGLHRIEENMCNY